MFVIRIYSYWTYEYAIHVFLKQGCLGISLKIWGI